MSGFDFYRKGWRPAAGWVCVVGLAWLLVIERILAFNFVSRGLVPPPLDLVNLLAVLGAGGGLATLRTIERVKSKGDST